MLTSACQTASPERRASSIAQGFAVVEFEPADYLLVFDAAERALAESFRIADRDVDSGIIRSEPVERSDAEYGVGPVSDATGAARRSRQLAEFRVRRVGPAVEVSCRVVVQHDRTEQVRLFDQDRGALDAPTDTPAERLASTTVEQNTYWADAHRDRAVERRLLAAVREFVQRADEAILGGPG